jgi:hypothetical protein
MPRIVLYPVAAIALLIGFAPMPAGASAALISETCQRSGWIYGFSSPVAADQIATRHCKQLDCKLARLAPNKCIELAIDNADQCGGKDCVVVAKLCDDPRLEYSLPQLSLPRHEFCCHGKLIYSSAFCCHSPP